MYHPCTRPATVLAETGREDHDGNRTSRAYCTYHGKNRKNRQAIPKGVK